MEQGGSIRTMKNKMMIAIAITAMSALFAQTPAPKPTKDPATAKTEKGKHKKHTKKAPAANPVKN